MSLPCKNCAYCLSGPDGRKCLKFAVPDPQRAGKRQLVETAIARYDGYDMCGKEGKFFVEARARVRVRGITPL